MPPGRMTAAALLASTLAGALAPALAAPEASNVPAGYRLVWADEFDVDGLPDPAKWVHDTVRNKEGWHNNELQYYSGPRAENAVVKGGRLLITARKESLSTLADWGGQRYTSARLITRGKADWTYGYFEVRAKVPCGRGPWPAAWTLGSGGKWPDDGELDFMEYWHRTPEQVSSAVHTLAGNAGRSSWASLPLPTACQAFHKYQMLWTSEGVYFGVDGFMYMHYPNQGLGPRAWPFDRPQFLLLNLAIGGDLGGKVDDSIFPVALEVDYVRIYQPAPKP